MDKREKVTKGLECCAVKIVTPDAVQRCGICPYDRERIWEMDFDCRNDLICDALKELKAQEPANPLVVGRGESFETAEAWWYECGNCGGALTLDDKYCRKCGREVKWDG